MHCVNSYHENNNKTYLISVVHGHRHSGAREIVNTEIYGLAVGRSVDKLQLARARGHKIAALVLVSECVTTNHNRLDPTRDRSRDLLQKYRLSEYSAIEDVSDGTVR